MKNGECPLEQDEDEEEEDEEEEEDVDFNPFLKETPSVEASSSLSSEIEGLDSGVVESGGNSSAPLATTLLSKPPYKVQDHGGVGDSEHGEEIVMQSAGLHEKENETSREKENASCSGTDVVNDVTFGELTTISNSRKLVMDIDDEEAICRRTRARYSLASFTLDELETFLQETDDDDDLQNVDDEEEYRKFLTAVLQGGDDDNQEVEKNGNVDDDDEDNDADFELEIEEALESDVDENIMGGAREQENEAAGRRPQTRQNKRQKVSGRHNKKLSGKLNNRPLRPLLPNAPIAPFPTLDGRKTNLDNAPPHCYPSSASNGNVNGFTPHQIGQLHCLIHEHVQLLIQVFSLCVFEPSREHIASNVQCLILEMLQKRDQALAWRRVPYPTFCFCPPYVHPSVADELANINFASKDKLQDVPNAHVGHFRTPEGSVWVPFVRGPVLSVTDVAPLHLVRSYVDEVSTAVRVYKRRYIESSCDTSFEKEPLFPFQSIQSSTEANGEVPKGTIPPVSKLVRSSGSDQTPKKTMAATLVERTKKQSVAPVPPKIAKLAQRFFPLFNPGLYPHKPPPTSVTNRVLFTEAEDDLLAMGLMEYNTDWKAIQQRFLPCKSKHQIFVRQKNRSSSKAPENSIKAVRRMKNSPLTPEEKARIEEGLKFYKLDWMSVWNFVVPYRDPSLLPRQWRIATGTQKSYKTDAAKREKRRLYELNRRLSKPEASARRKTSSEKEDCSTDNADGENNSGDDYTDNEDEAYVHEAFLADWRPSTSGVPPVSNLGENTKTAYLLLQGGCHIAEQFNNSGSRDSQLQINYSQHPHTSSSFQPNQPVSHVPVTSSKPQIILRPYRARRTNRARLVKLAPDLPPVNLPPSVRVMSQSAFQNFQGGQPSKVSGAGGVRHFGPASQNIVRKLPCVANAGPRQDKTIPVESGIVTNTSVAEENDDSDLQMHPLLFQAPEDGQLPYYPLNCSTSSSSSFDFFSRNQPQLNLSLFQHHQKANQTLNFFEKSLKSKERSSSSFGIDFHPLLQRTDDVNSDPVTEHPANPDLLTDQWAQLQNPVDLTLPNSLVNSSSVATSAIPSSPLDLEMHLSFSSRKDKAGAGEKRDVIVHMTRSSESDEDLGAHASVIPDNDLGAHESVIPDNDVSRIRVNNNGDQSLPEIVMEQEELSDSEDEVGEGVEFECEEMDDSEGEEGSDAEQIGNMQNKEVPHDATEKNSIDADINDQQHGPSSDDNSEGNVGDPSESSTYRMDKKPDHEKDNPTRSLHLNLNSCPPLSPVTSPMDPSNENERVSTGNSRTTSRLSRSCKNTTQQSNLDSLAVTPLRKPRKRAQKTASNLRMGRARKSDASSKICTTVEISDPVSTNQEVPHAATETTSIDADFNDQQQEPTAHDNSEGNVGDPSESSTFRMDIKAEQEKDNPTSTLLLNLNTCPPLSPIMSPMDLGNDSERLSAGNNRTTSRLSRSCKNTTQQSSLDSLSVTPLRNPRKRAHKTASKLRTSRARKRDASLKTDAAIEISDPVSPNQVG